MTADTGLTSGTVRWRSTTRFVGIAGLLILIALSAAMTVGLAAGWRIFIVDSASMSPTLPEGAVAVVAATSPSEVAPGDVIAFRSPSDRSLNVVHRVVDIREVEGDLYFRTAGDANRNPDPLLVRASELIGSYRFQIPGMGELLTALSGILGVVVLVVVPASLLLGTEIRNWMTRQS